MTEVLTNDRPKRRRPWALYVLAAVCAAPAVAAWIVYSVPGLLPEARGNRGTLVQPALSLPASIDGEVFEGKWSMVTWAGEFCAEPCRARVFDMQQVRLALAEHRDRTGRFVLASEGAQQALEIDESWPGTRVLEPGPAAFRELQASLARAGAAPVEGSVYLVDPMGELMMAYGPEQPAEDFLADLEKLFQASKNWIDGVNDGNR